MASKQAFSRKAAVGCHLRIMEDGRTYEPVARLQDVVSAEIVRKFMKVSPVERKDDQLPRVHEISTRRASSYISRNIHSRLAMPLFGE